MSNVRTIRSTHKPRHRGASLLEFAIVLPLLLLLIGGVLEYGWMFLKSHQIANACRQGARFAATPSATQAGAQSLIASIMSDAGMSASGYTVTWNPALPGVAAGQPFKCTVSLAYANVSLGFALVPTPTTLSSSVTMMKEGP